jgi:hypothetical protein
MLFDATIAAYVKSRRVNCIHPLGKGRKFNSGDMRGKTLSDHVQRVLFYFEAAGPRD